MDTLLNIFLLALAFWGSPPPPQGDSIDTYDTSFLCFKSNSHNKVTFDTGVIQRIMYIVLKET